MNEVELPTLELRRADFSEAAYHELRVRVGPALLRLIPSAGESFVEAFWDHVDRLRRIVLALQEGDTGDDDDWDRRETYRVPMVEEFRPEVQLSHMPPGGSREELSARLTDISMGGCSVVTKQDLSALDGLEVTIPYNSEVPKIDLDGSYNEPPDRIFTAEATVVHKRPAAGGAPQRFGLGYGGMDSGKREEAREVWMQFQREEAARKQWLMEETEEQELAKNIAEQSQAVAREIVLAAREAAKRGDGGAELPDFPEL